MFDNEKDNETSEIITYERIRNVSKSIIEDFLKKQSIGLENKEIIIGYGTGLFKNNSLFVGSSIAFYQDFENLVKINFLISLFKNWLTKKEHSFINF